MKKNNLKLISDAICGCLVLISVLVYVILGLAIGWWHPGWVIIVGAAIVSGIISIVTGAIVASKAQDEPKKEDPKFTDLTK